MTGDQPERRWKKRTLVRLPVWIQLQPSDPHRHMGMVRDMNRKGIFFYSDFGSTPGDQLEFVLRFPAWTNNAPISCKGKVVRCPESSRRGGVRGGRQLEALPRTQISRNNPCANSSLDRTKSTLRFNCRPAALEFRSYRLSHSAPLRRGGATKTIFSPSRAVAGDDDANLG